MHSIFVWYFLSLTGRIKRQEFSLGYFGLLAMCGLLTRLLTEVAFFNTAGRTWRYEELMVALSLPFLFAILILICSPRSRSSDCTISIGRAGGCSSRWQSRLPPGRSV